MCLRRCTQKWLLRYPQPSHIPAMTRQFEQLVKYVLQTADEHPFSSKGHLLLPPGVKALCGEEDGVETCNAFAQALRDRDRAAWVMFFHHLLRSYAELVRLRFIGEEGWAVWFEKMVNISPWTKCYILTGVVEYTQTDYSLSELSSPQFTGLFKAQASLEEKPPGKYLILLTMKHDPQHHSVKGGDVLICESWKP